MKAKNDYLYAPPTTQFWVARIYREKDGELPEDITEKYAYGFFMHILRNHIPGIGELRRSDQCTAQSAAYVLRAKAAKDKANAGYKIDARAEIISSF